MSKVQSLQDPFLNTCIVKSSKSIYLVNIRLQDLVESFDQFVVLLTKHKYQVVYKHAISTKQIPSCAYHIDQISGNNKAK